jgi:hypothetical protein
MKRKVIIVALIVIALLAGTVAVASQLKKSDDKSSIIKGVWGTDNK